MSLDCLSSSHTRNSLSRRSRGSSSNLLSLNPEFSANEPVVRWQRWAMGAIVFAVVLGAVLAPRTTLAVLLAFLAIPFLCVVLLRTSALFYLWKERAKEIPPDPLRDDELPTYSVLVPLFEEAEIVPDLIEALEAIDYPRDKLEVFLIVESADPKTYNAVFDTPLPEFMRVIVVPTRPPQTKPQALNYAFQFAKGSCVVVYDAEDMPDPEQLRCAAALLMRDSNIGCVQACLNVYNSKESFFTRQFTIEYTALFDCILPTLRMLGFPVPLGGTSNHFPRAVLSELGGWDSYNVTEDADLGICLARADYRVAILSSTTWEEAPENYSIWLRQRTRWLKGWMQTYLIHMRQPRRLLHELGGRGFIGLQVFMGGVLLSVLVHPWFYVLALLDLWSGVIFHSAVSTTGEALWWIGVFNLIAGYFAGVALGIAAVRARGWHHLALSGLWMPVYWLLISGAAYRALWQLAHAPFYWEKTEHRARTPQVAKTSQDAG